jgi:hypothetical protein
MQKLTCALVLSAFAAVSQAADLCAVSPYTRAEAEAGKAAFKSRCAQRHQYSMAGRVPATICDFCTMAAAMAEFSAFASSAAQAMKRDRELGQQVPPAGHVLTLAMMHYTYHATN